MKKDFDFDDIGKRTPYRTPDGFFEDVQRKVMERAGVKQQRKSHTKLIISTVITIAAVWVGFLFVPSLRQADEVTTSSSKVLANGTEPVDKWIKELSDEELEKFFKKPTVNVGADEFIFLREAEMTFSHAWKAMPKKYKHPDSEQFYREIFHPEARHKYPRAEIVANFRRMINEGKLNPIE